MYIPWVVGEGWDAGHCDLGKPGSTKQNLTQKYQEIRKFKSNNTFKNCKNKIKHRIGFLLCKV